MYAQDQPISLLESELIKSFITSGNRSTLLKTLTYFMNFGSMNNVNLGEYDYRFLIKFMSMLRILKIIQKYFEAFGHPVLIPVFASFVRERGIHVYNPVIKPLTRQYPEFEFQT